MDEKDGKMTLDQAVFMPFDEVQKAQGIVMHRKNCWWIVHPEKGLLFYPYRQKNRSLSKCAAQCNHDELTAKKLGADLWPGTEIRFIESVLQPLDPSDYAP
jgi:hypothetical protein